MNQNTLYAMHEEAVIFVKDEITYVPHYRNSSVFVGPGYGKHNVKQYSEFELFRMGAEKAFKFLWHRGTHGTVNAIKL